MLSRKKKGGERQREKKERRERRRRRKGSVFLTDKDITHGGHHSLSPFSLSFFLDNTHRFSRQIEVCFLLTYESIDLFSASLLLCQNLGMCVASILNGRRDTSSVEEEQRLINRRPVRKKQRSSEARKTIEKANSILASRLRCRLTRR